jgi:hypothetical protein
MKQKLFENVGGNNFRLITENVEESNAKNVREGIRKVFSTGKGQISYKLIQNVGLGYIKDVNEAKKCALQEARFVAKECGYMEDEGNSKFVKNEVHDESDMSNPAEKREVQIGKEILQALENINASSGSGSLLEDIRKLATELIQMHSGSGEKKPYAGTPFLGGGHGGL